MLRPMNYGDMGRFSVVMGGSSLGLSISTLGLDT